MWNLLSKVLAFVVISSSACAQSQLNSLNGKTYDAYFMRSGNYLIIDSTTIVDTTNLKAQLSITFPKNTADSGDLRKGQISYGAIPFDPNNCSFHPFITITLDSIFITTMSGSSQIYDPCAGHTDFAEVIWEMFEDNVKASYTKSGNNIMMTWDDGKKMLGLSLRI